MKKWYVLLLLLALGMGIVSVPALAQIQSLSVDPNYAPPPGNPPLSVLPAAGTLINDGSFENGPPPTSAWTQWSDLLPNVWVLDPIGVFQIPAYQGTYAFWAGGYVSTPNSNYVEQGIAIPAGAQTLHFQSVFDRIDPDDPPFTDVFTVSLNGAVVFTRDMVQANNTYPQWVEQVVDISAFAGQTVTLRFEAASTGDQTGNVLVDYITIDGVAQAVPTLNQWGLVVLLVLTGITSIYFLRRKRKA